MKKYGGILIHENHDDDGILEIVEDGDVRSLHFGSSSRQSSMLMSDPHYLQLSYLRAMTSALIFNPKPKRILNIGLGGGSLVKFLLRHLPDCQIEAVEYRKSVARIAVSYFGLVRDQRLHIFIGDGGRYAQEAAQSNAYQYDMVYVDAFDHDGMSIKVNETVFYAACKQLLSAKGIMVINIWGSNRPLFKRTADCLNLSFSHRVLYLPVKGRGNIIAIAFAKGFPVLPMKYLQTRAALLGDEFSVELPKFLKELKRHNRTVFKQLISK